MNYRYRAAKRFWKSYGKLPAQQKSSAQEAYKIFKENPFDARLNPHKINKLSGLMGETVYSVTIEADLKALFVVRDDTILTLDIGTHDVYK